MYVVDIYIMLLLTLDHDDCDDDCDDDNN